MNNNCLQHQLPNKWKCAQCAKEMCEQCHPASYKGKDFCPECSRKDSSNQSEISGKEMSFKKLLAAYKLFSLVSGVGVALFLLWIAFRISRGMENPNLWEVIVFGALWFGGILYGIYFWVMLLCPSCGCHLSFYFGGNLIEQFRFRNCPRCGYALEE